MKRVTLPLFGERDFNHIFTSMLIWFRVDRQIVPPSAEASPKQPVDPRNHRPGVVMNERRDQTEKSKENTSQSQPAECLNYRVILVSKNRITAYQLLSIISWFKPEDEIGCGPKFIRAQLLVAILTPCPVAILNCWKIKTAQLIELLTASSAFSSVVALNLNIS